MPVTTRKWRILALLLTAILVLAACGSDDKTDSSTDSTTGDGDGITCSNLSLAFFGAVTGDNAALGQNMLGGVKLALKEFNDENPDCQVGYKDYDTQGDAAQAPALASQAVQDKDVVGIVGPAFSGESRTANPIFDEAGLPTITPSATGIDLSTNGWKVFHRAVGNDNAQGPAIAKYLKDTAKATKVAVLDDKTEYGKGIADIVRDELGSAVAVSDSFDDKTTEFSSTINKIKGAKADAVVFGGYYSQAGPLAKQLKDAGVDALFLGPDGVNDAGFVDAAGTAAEGAILTAPSAPIDKVEGGGEFTANFKKINSRDPGLYSGEAYDATNMFLEAIKAGKTTRADINTYLSSDLDYEGITKTYKFGPDGELSGLVTVYAYEVKSGKIVGVGPIS